MLSFIPSVLFEFFFALFNSFIFNLKIKLLFS